MGSDNSQLSKRGEILCLACLLNTGIYGWVAKENGTVSCATAVCEATRATAQPKFYLMVTSFKSLWENPQLSGPHENVIPPCSGSWPTVAQSDAHRGP